MWLNMVADLRRSKSPDLYAMARWYARIGDTDDAFRVLDEAYRAHDGQLLFLANMLSKMKHSTKLGSRIAEVHNGSSLFTGDAGQGEPARVEGIFPMTVPVFHNGPANS